MGYASSDRRSRPRNADGFFFVRAVRGSSCAALWNLVSDRLLNASGAYGAIGSIPASMRVMRPRGCRRRRSGAHGVRRVWRISPFGVRANPRNPACAARKNACPEKSPNRSVYVSVAVAAASLQAALAMGRNSFGQNGSQIKPL
jgi:hypothetical protein